MAAGKRARVQQRQQQKQVHWGSCKGRENVRAQRLWEGVDMRAARLLLHWERVHMRVPHLRLLPWERVDVRVPPRLLPGVRVDLRVPHLLLCWNVVLPEKLHSRKVRNRE